MHRVGIIPFETKKKAIAILFVTSQTRGRWILPKGLAKKNETHADTCRREGFEEAGCPRCCARGLSVHGADRQEGRRLHGAGAGDLLSVSGSRTQKDKWPDQDRRERHWALIEDAHQR